VARRGHRGERVALNAEINVVNLIDVMLLLMVIFMLTTPMMQGGVDVSLPKASVEPLQATQRSMTVTVTADGSILVDDTRLTLDEFRGSFAALAAKERRDGVFLRADQSVPYGTVVQVLAVIRGTGISDVGLVAEPENAR
jgi:biopolymer transport protein ExbD/biopolymer transport protein TolR